MYHAHDTYSGLFGAHDVAFEAYESFGDAGQSGLDIDRANLLPRPSGCLCMLVCTAESASRRNVGYLIAACLAVFRISRTLRWTCP